MTVAALHMLAVAWSGRLACGKGPLYDGIDTKKRRCGDGVVVDR